ncbi:MAG: phosphatidylglycerophosphatase A [Candidatus Omnitrophica bacterium]|nr:phosphatidylglycerophosphatase A [Candidatus Omnitrophota bacterium]
MVRNKIAKFTYTCFYIGYLPLAPGTWASLAALGVYYLLRNHPLIYVVLTLLAIILGFWSSSIGEKELGRKDPPEVVIDEFSSQLLVFVFIPFNLLNLCLGFILFRAFDIFKIPPVKKLERLPRGWGIMLDDIAVAIFVNIILKLTTFL